MADSSEDRPEEARSVADRWSRQRLAVLALVLVSLVVADLRQPPAEQLSTRALLAGIDFYQRRISPWSAALGARCRFEPSCSHYGEAVVRRYGAAKGTWLAARRIARCGPWTEAGTLDPPS